MSWELVVCVSVCVSCMFIGDSDVLNMSCVGVVRLCSLTAVYCAGVLGGAGLRCFLK